MPRKLWMSGIGGFVGHHFCEHILANTDWQITGIDSFRHKGKTDRVAEVLAARPEWRKRVTVKVHDLAAPFTAASVEDLGEISYVVAMASDSHVDRSITDPVPFIRNNVELMMSTLELCRVIKPEAVLIISTDEVYGPAAIDVAHPEWDPILPSSPYGASKACQEAIAISYWRTFGVPVVIANFNNILAERQDTEKFLPMLIQKISTGETVQIHGRPGNIGSRHYIHARNASDALLYVLQHLPPARFPDSLLPDRYNVAGTDAISNLTLALRVAEIMGKPLHYELLDFHSARPGHDPHYGLDMSKLTRLGWKAPVPFDESLEHIVHWSLAHPQWLKD